MWVGLERAQGHFLPPSSSSPALGEHYDAASADCPERASLHDLCLSQDRRPVFFLSWLEAKTF